ncbi:MAG TPA: endonuclease V [Anaeromyxobacter sp.]|nr:endonuclease V [Anaeromyxobacter sp.]
MTWPPTAEDLAREQDRLAALAPAPWEPPDWLAARPLRTGACAVVFGRAGGDGVGWAAAVVEEGEETIAASAGVARVNAPFQPGRLALREGAILEAVVRDLAIRPDVLLVAAAGRDHPRRAGLALHLGAALDLPTVGVTDEPLRATGSEPGPEWMARSPLRLGGEVVAYRVRARRGAKPIVAHAAWRTSAEVAADVALRATALARWPEPLREARRLARELRGGARE